MKRALFISTASGLVLVGSAAKARGQSTDQNSDGKWDGPGYYAEHLEKTTSGSVLGFFKVGGPFASYDDCEAYMQQKGYQSREHPGGRWYEYYSCVYRDSDPNYSGCFVTTACVQYAGLPDNCEELTAMRRFRDNYLSRYEEGRLLIDHYYRIAPRIVERIHRASDRDRILDWVLREVRATVRAIGRGESERAIERYATMVLRLQRHYAIAPSHACP